MSEPVDFAVINGIKRLDRLTDGRVMCCICFGYFTRDELEPAEDGKVWDMCRDCAQTEKQYEEACHE